MKRVQIRMKTSKDTLRRCEELDQDWRLYFGGYTRPHFAMPAQFKHTPDCAYALELCKAILRELFK